MTNRLKNKKGFTLAEVLIVVAILAVLVAISIPIFTSRLEKSREAVDMSTMRSAKSAMSIGLMTGEIEADTWYYYDAGSGTLSTSTKPSAYGKSHEDSQTFWDYAGESAVGVPQDKVLKVSITEAGAMSYKWGNAYGSTYKAVAQSDLADKKTLLTPDTSTERVAADRDVMQAIGDSFLGMSYDDMVAAVLKPENKNRGNNLKSGSDGIVLFTYRENGYSNGVNEKGENTKYTQPNPQVRPGESGDLSLMAQFGYANNFGEISSNSFANSETRLLFSDFCNDHNKEVQVRIGNVKFDENGKANQVEIWITGGSGDKPDELKNIIVTAD